MSEPELAERLESFVRDSFDVTPGDDHFGRDIDLFEQGYVDSVGLTELLAFMEEEFQVEVPEDDLLSDEFATIDGMAGVLARLSNR
ncbi:MAG: acyl carrier protein [Solirubrobacterales bacterium]